MTASSTTPTGDISLPADMSRLKGKNILITGGASGLGLAMFREFARHGYLFSVPRSHAVSRLNLFTRRDSANVVIADLNAEKGNKLVEGVRKDSNNLQ